jgi:Tfp pilus assembly protein PilX
MNKGAWLRVFCFPTRERGAALITGLLLLLVLTILGLAGMMTTIMELKIAANDRSAKQVFYIAEAGVEDGRTRLQVSASASPISDNYPADSSWTAFIGTSTRATEKGYQSSNPKHALYNPLISSKDYVVSIAHKLNASGNILKWGDSNGDGILEENTTVGQNIYVINSEGYTADGASKALKTEVVKAPPIPTYAALYTKEATTIQGTSVSVLGMDHCGSANVPGVLTMATVGKNGNPTITGSPSAVVEHSSLSIDVPKYVNDFKGRANYSYDANSATLTGMSWGNPTPGATQQDASSCSAKNVVYFNTSSTYVKLAGGSQGCGVLLVDGDLSVQGGFQWYGVIIVTGSIIFTGGGAKNVTGAMLAGGTASADLVGGDANIVYCSQAVNSQTDSLPLITLRWVELFS